MGGLQAAIRGVTRLGGVSRLRLRRRCGVVLLLLMAYGTALGEGPWWSSSGGGGGDGGRSRRRGDRVGGRRVGTEPHRFGVRGGPAVLNPGDWDAGFLVGAFGRKNMLEYGLDAYFFGQEERLVYPLVTLRTDVDFDIYTARVGIPWQVVRFGERGPAFEIYTGTGVAWWKSKVEIDGAIGGLVLPSTAIEEDGFDGLLELGLGVNESRPGRKVAWGARLSAAGFIPELGGTVISLTGSAAFGGAGGLLGGGKGREIQPHRFGIRAGPAVLTDGGWDQGWQLGVFGRKTGLEYGLDWTFFGQDESVSDGIVTVKTDSDLDIFAARVGIPWKIVRFSERGPALELYTGTGLAWWQVKARASGAVAGFVLPSFAIDEDSFDGILEIGLGVNEGRLGQETAWGVRLNATAIIPELNTGVVSLLGSLAF